MISVETYLQRIEALLLHTGGVVDSSLIIIDPSGNDSIGTLTLTLRYPHGHRLHVSATVDVAAGYPDWILYSFQLLSPEDRCVFRYDNAPHYRSMPTFPHHKHVGPVERPEPNHLPTIHELVEEIMREFSKSIP